MNGRTLYRSVDDRIIAGVSGGLADYFDTDPSLVRILWVIAAFVTAGLAIVVYIVMAIVLPEAEGAGAKPDRSDEERDRAVGGGEYPASYAPPGGLGGPAPSDSGAPETPPNEGAAETTQTWTQTEQGWVAGAPGTSSPYPAGSGYDRRWERRQQRWQERELRRQARSERREHRDGSSGAIVWGLLLILVGAILLLQRIDPAFSLARTWPVLIIGFGAILVVLSVIRGIGRS